ncbi:MAG TPA: hypothetical protein VGX95_03795 [Xanthobacteraceae bacterium]|nr:hypothetical protein [Xanthobacteraceae bacterium]
MSDVFVQSRERARKSCFVIMPFGQKRDILPDGQKQDIDFDRIYAELIKPVAESLAVECTRSDEVSKSGLIHKDMIERILGSDVVVVDITTLNANVFYELGVRHTARPTGTVLVRMAHKPIPFNIGGMRVAEYDCTTAEALEHSRQILLTHLQNSLVDRAIDSLVHSLIPGLRVSRRPMPIPVSERFEYESGVDGKHLGMITGDITKVEGVDIWVNPENTKMEMARLHDDSVSACIRYFGAKRGPTGSIARDTVRDELRKRIGLGATVEPGTVIATSSGELRRLRGVKIILHVAGQHGEPGRGYMPIRNYRICIDQAIETAERLSQHAWYRFRYGAPFASMIFPLFGTQSSDRDPQDVVVNMVLAARTFLQAHPDAAIKRIYFLAYTDGDRELCETAFSRLRLQPVVATTPPRPGTQRAP